MALLDSVLEVRDASKSTGGGNYLNPSQIEKDQTVRITILGNQITRRLRVLGHQGRQALLDEVQPNPPATTSKNAPTKRVLN